MKSVEAPVRLARDDYQTCIDHADTAEEIESLVRRRGDVEALYAAYAAGRRRPHQVESSRLWEADWSFQRETWRHAGGRGALDDLYGKALDAAGFTCVLCNDRPAGEVDHFLPRRVHPALSVLFLNLVGVCDKCNKHKGSSCRAEPTEQFVHPYFDAVPAEVFLHCSPFSAGVFLPVFRLETSDAWPDEMGTRLAWQFERLHLDKYYGHAATHWFKGQSGAWLDAARQGWDTLETSLEGALRSESGANGENTWIAAVLRSMLQDPALRADPVTMIVRNGRRGLAAGE